MIEIFILKDFDPRKTFFLNSGISEHFLLEHWSVTSGTRSKSTRDQNTPSQIREPLTDRG